MKVKSAVTSTHQQAWPYYYHPSISAADINACIIKHNHFAQTVNTLKDS